MCVCSFRVPLFACWLSNVHLIVTLISFSFPVHPHFHLIFTRTTGVCVYRLNRRKTSSLYYIILYYIILYYIILYYIIYGRGMECASDVSIQRRRICCTVIWIGDAQSTHLLNLLLEFGHGNHSGELLLFVGCFVNFVVSYLICMFQDSVPAGSYNDPFLSCVCVCARAAGP